MHMIFLLIEWDSIPDEIGIHYTAGNPDGFGSKYVLFLLPLISLITWFSLGLARKTAGEIKLSESDRTKQGTTVHDE